MPQSTHPRIVLCLMTVILQPFQKDIMFKEYQKTLTESTNALENGKHYGSDFFFVFTIFPNTRGTTQ